MSSLRLLADVHISPLTVATLNLQGYDTVRQKLLDVLPSVATELIAGAAVTINDDSVRVRQLPIRRSDI